MVLWRLNYSKYGMCTGIDIRDYVNGITLFETESHMYKAFSHCLVLKKTAKKYSKSEQKIVVMKIGL